MKSYFLLLSSSEFIDFCVSSPCQNDGLCVNERSSFNCICVTGWRGIDCSIGDTHGVAQYINYNYL